MAGKKYRGKSCAYCGEESSTEDHVFARGFFPEHRRSDLIKVPACDRCNGIKSNLEHYAASVLPFAASDDASSELVDKHIERRLDRNLKLKRELTSGIVRESAGEGIEAVMLPLRPKNLIALFAMISQGLLYHHFEVVLQESESAHANLLEESAEPKMREKLLTGGSLNVHATLGKGSVEYIGQRAQDNPASSVWMIQLYRRLGIKDKISDQKGSVFIGITGPPGFCDAWRNKGGNGD